MCVSLFPVCVCACTPCLRGTWILGSHVIAGIGGISVTACNFNETVASHTQPHTRTQCFSYTRGQAIKDLVTSLMQGSVVAAPVCHSVMGFNADLTVPISQQMNERRATDTQGGCRGTIPQTSLASFNRGSRVSDWKMEGGWRD